MLKSIGSLLAGFLLLAVAVYAVLFEPLPMVDVLFLVIVGAGLFLVGFVEARAGFIRRRVASDSPTFRRFLLDQLAVLRTLGFFEKYANLTDNVLATKLVKRCYQEFDSAVGDLVRDPVQVALLDPIRAVHLDTELPTPPGEGGYSEVLEDLARISHGAFDPQDIRERITDDGQHVDVRFTVNGNEECIRARLQDDWIDPDFIPALDRFVTEAGRQFVIPDWGGQDFLVLCLSDDEQKALREKLKWPV